MRRVTRSAMAVGWLAAVVALIGCAGEDRPDPSLSAEAQQGWHAYKTLGCGSCHGDQLEGKRSGPALTGIADHWQQDSLVTYLKDPPAMIKVTPRLAYRAEQYPIAMPGFVNKADEATLAQIATYLLES